MVSKEHKQALNRVRTKRYRLRHPERAKKSSLKYYHENIEARREYGRKRYYSDPSLQIESSKRWRHKYPEKARNNVQRRRARLKGAVVADCAVKIKEIRSSSHCYWCDHIGKVEVDHVLPIEKGGMHHPDNLVASCRKCNASKADRFYWEWDGDLAA